MPHAKSDVLESTLRPEASIDVWLLHCLVLSRLNSVHPLRCLRSARHSAHLFFLARAHSSVLFSAAGLVSFSCHDPPPAGSLDPVSLFGPLFYPPAPLGYLYTAWCLLWCFAHHIKLVSLSDMTCRKSSADLNRSQEKRGIADARQMAGSRLISSVSFLLRSIEIANEISDII